MHDVVAQRSRISQSAGGEGDGKDGGGSSAMRQVRGDGSQFGQASVGSIHIGDRKRACPVCENTISSDNRSVVCSKCAKKFCETCEGYFRTERKRGEKPLCEKCFAENRQLVEQERRRRQKEEEQRKQEEERHRQEAAARQPQAGQIWTSPLSIEFVYLSAGTFTMGSAEFGDAPHQVTLTRSFYMGKYPVTQREWAMVMGNNPSDFKGDTRPVENVSWNDCQEFIRKLNAREGTNKYRLRTGSGSALATATTYSPATPGLTTTRMMRPTQWVGWVPTTGASTTCTAMSGSGAMIGMGIILQVP